MEEKRFKKIFTLRKAAIEIIKENIKNSVYDYLVNWNDDEYSIVHIVDSENDINYKLEGWHLWVVINPDEETEELLGKDNCLFLQTVIGPHGYDHHILSEQEIDDFVTFFSIGNYEMNNIKNKWYKL